MEPAQFSVLETVRKSLKLAWKHKILWVFALLLAGGISRMGNNINYPGSDSSESDMEQDYDFFENTDVPDMVSVLGLSTLAQASPFAQPEAIDAETPPVPVESEELTPEEIIRELEMQTGEEVPQEFIDLIYESNMPEGALEGNYFYGPGAFPASPTYPGYQGGQEETSPIDPEILSLLSGIGQRALPNLILLIIVFVFTALFYMAIWLIVSQWAQGAILTGVDDAIKGDSYTLRKLGTHGRISARELVKLKVLIFLVFFVFMLTFSIPVAFFTINENYFVSLIIVFISVVVGAVLWVCVSYGSIFATRLVTLKRYEYIDSLKEGIKIFKKNFIKALFMSCANCLVFVVIGFVSLIVLAVGGVAVFGIGGALISSESIRTVVLVILGILSLPIAFAFLAGIMAVRAYYTTYTQFTWSYLFNFATKTDETASEKVEAPQEKLETKTETEGLEVEGKDGE